MDEFILSTYPNIKGQEGQSFCFRQTRPCEGGLCHHGQTYNFNTGKDAMVKPMDEVILPEYQKQDGQKVNH